MSRLFDRYRSHRERARRARAIEDALRNAPRSVRDELLEMAGHQR